VATDEVVWDNEERRLVAAGWLFAAATAVHTFDHLRRGQGSITDTLNRTGTVSLLLQVVVITMVVTHHRLAPEAAAATGFPLAVGFAAVHWLPRWSSLSDSFLDAHAAPFSWFASAFEIGAALAIGVAGVQVLRSRD
jgi:hypothetical protein